jgi:N-acetyl-gamma-glutamylphosphate reductase
MVESSAPKGIRLALIGSTGAIGLEVVDYLKKDTRFAEIILLCRSAKDDWTQENFTPKLTLIKKGEFDNFDDCKSQLKGVDAFLCCLGTRVKVGEELFVKVDY